MPLLIAASDALQQSKNRADLLCDGVDDQEQINAALMLLSATGGEVALSEGTFHLSETLDLSAGPISITGSGPLSTRLLFSLALSTDGIKAGGTVARHSRVSNLGIEGVANMRYGLYVLEQSAYNVFDNLRILNANEAGVRNAGGTLQSSQNLFQSIHVREFKVLGFSLWGCADSFVQCLASRTVHGGTAFHVQESGSSFVGCVADNADRGVSVGGYTAGVSFHGLHMERCGVGLRIMDGGAGPHGVSVHGGLIVGSTNATLAAIHIGGSTGTLIDGALVRDTVCGRSIRVEAGAVDCRMVHNRLEDAQPYDIEPGVKGLIIS